MRNAYEPIPWLATPANPPGVSAAVGLGTGGGAGVFTPDGSGFGVIELQMGSNPSAGGHVDLKFAQAPPTLFFSGSEGLGNLTVTNQGTTTVTVTWDGTPRLGSKQRIQYEWSVST